jgi:autotransporter-associated beta strand protein
MKKPFRHMTSVLSVLVLVLCIQVSQAGSATWDLNPISGDWNTATNWTPASVPNGSADTATFAFSNTTAISTSANTTVDGITFAPGASSFTITANSGFILTISGVGITNNSGVPQNFVGAISNSNAVRLVFNGSATAGSETFFTMNGGGGGLAGGFVVFNDNATAGNGSFTNNGTAIPDPSVGFQSFGGQTGFFGSSTAGNGTFINNGATVSKAGGGGTDFTDNSTAANGTFINNGGTVSGEFGGETGFFGSSTAGNATITNNGGTVSGASGGETHFEGLFSTATAGNATITNNGGTVSGASGGLTTFEGFFDNLRFFASSTAGNATIINNGASISGAGGGETVFFTDFNSSNPLGASTAGNATLIANGGTGGGQGGAILFKGLSTGGTSRIEVFGNGKLDISFHNGLQALAVGSIEGDGNVFLGANHLIVGTNTLSTTFSGVIQDGGANGGTGGSLTKIGSGTLVLAGANTYSGDTTIKQGVLQVDGSITSNTFIHHGSTLTGTGTIKNSVSNNGTVRPGDGTPGTLAINGNYSQTSHGTLLIDLAGANAGAVSLLDVLGAADLKGLLDPVLENGFIPTVGESFTFLEYGSHSGSLFIHDRNIDGTMEHWLVTYQPGVAVLTVAPGNVSVPDQGSTVLLLALGLLAVVTWRSQLLRRSA